MKKIFMIIAVVIFSLLLSSCIKVDTNVSINKNFGVNETVTMDSSKINEITRSKIEKLKQEAKTDTGIVIKETATGYLVTHKSEFGDYTETVKKVENPCVKFNEEKDKSNEKDLLHFQDKTCTVLDKNYDKVKQEFKNGNIKDFVTQKEGKYVLDLTSVIGKSEKKDRDQNLQEGFKMMQNMGMQFDYNLELPSKIISSDLGKFEGNKLSFNLNDLASSNKEKPTVTFEKFDTDKKIPEEISVVQSVISKTKIELTKQAILAKNNLLHSKYKKFVLGFEKGIYKLSSQKIISLNNKINKLPAKARYNKKYKDLFDYLEAKLSLEIIRRGLNK